MCWYQMYIHFYMFVFDLWFGTLFYIIIGYKQLLQFYQIKSCSLNTLFIKCYVENINDNNKYNQNNLVLLSYLLCFSIFILMCTIY